MHSSIRALPTIRLPHLHLAHPWYRPIVSLIRTIQFHTFEVPRAGLSFTLDPHPVISSRLITGSGVHTKGLILCVYVPQSFLLLFSFSRVFIPFSALGTTCGRC